MEMTADGQSKISSCPTCGGKLVVIRYLEEDCTFYYEVGCPKMDSQSMIFQVGRPLKPGSMCPNCLTGMMKQVPIQDSDMRLICDSCLVVIPFGYATKAISK